MCIMFFNMLKELFKKPELPRVLTPNIKSEEVDKLLSGEMVERLVRANRTPLQIGTIGASTEEGMDMQPYYQIPPKGFNPKKDEIFMTTGGCLGFQDELGKIRLGETFTLTEEKSKEVEQRIAEEEERIGTRI